MWLTEVFVRLMLQMLQREKKVKRLTTMTASIWEAEMEMRVKQMYMERLIKGWQIEEDTVKGSEGKTAWSPEWGKEGGIGCESRQERQNQKETGDAEKQELGLTNRDWGYLEFLLQTWLQQENLVHGVWSWMHDKCIFKPKLSNKASIMILLPAELANEGR